MIRQQINDAKKIIVNDKSFQVHPIYDVYAGSEDGEVIHVNRQVPLRGNDTLTGYLVVSVRSKDDRDRVMKLVHRFIWECYFGFIPENMVIDHINDIRDDNRLENLALMTNRMNNLKSARNRDYSFLGKNHENRKHVRAVSRDDGSVLFFNSLYSVNKRLGVNAGIVKNVCERQKCAKTGTSKKNGMRYAFDYVTKEEFDQRTCFA